jgi:hypothetical protein
MLAVELDCLVGVTRGGDIVKYVAVVSKSFVDEMKILSAKEMPKFSSFKLYLYVGLHITLPNSFLPCFNSDAPLSNPLPGFSTVFSVFCSVSIAAH